VLHRSGRGCCAEAAQVVELELAFDKPDAYTLSIDGQDMCASQGITNTEHLTLTQPSKTVRAVAKSGRYGFAPHWWQVITFLV
jgi:hypothetical protein